MTTVAEQRGDGPRTPGEQGTTILIDRKEYAVPWPIHGENIMTGLEIRGLADPPVDESRDLFEIVPGGSDRKIDDDAKVTIRDGMRFFSAPRQINPGRGGRVNTVATDLGEGR